MGKKIICENIPPDKKIKDLVDLFEAIGTVEWAVIELDGETQRSTGIAYVEMLNDFETMMVGTQWDKKEWHGNILRIRDVTTEITPEMLPDKKLMLIYPAEYIYSLIRFEVNAPPVSMVVINGVAKERVDQSGIAIVRALLPGDYDIKVLYRDTEIGKERVSLNCLEVPAPFNISLESA